MSGRHICFQRIKKHWKGNIRIFRIIADWTIWVYMIIPAIVVFFIVYFSWWKETPEWISGLPFELFFFLSYLFAWMGQYRTFIEEADQAFLMKKKRTFISLKRWGVIYSVLLETGKFVLVFCLFLPFMVNYYALPQTQIFLFFFLFISMKFLIMHVKFRLRKIERKLYRNIVQMGLFVLLMQVLFQLWNGFPTLCIPISFVFMLGAFFFHFRTTKDLFLFARELEMEREEKMKLTNTIFSLSPDIEKFPISNRKRPLLFRKSRLIFKNRTFINGFKELYIKTFLRNRAYYGVFLQIISLTSVCIILIPPLWAKAVIFLGFLIMMRNWIDGTWERIISKHPLTFKYKSQENFYMAKKMVIRGLMIIAIFITTAFVGVGGFLFLHFNI